MAVEEKTGCWRSHITVLPWTLAGGSETPVWPIRERSGPWWGEPGAGNYSAADLVRIKARQRHCHGSYEWRWCRRRRKLLSLSGLLEPVSLWRKESVGGLVGSCIVADWLQSARSPWAKPQVGRTGTHGPCCTVCAVFSCMQHAGCWMLASHGLWRECSKTPYVKKSR